MYSDCFEGPLSDDSKDAKLNEHQARPSERFAKPDEHSAKPCEQSGKPSEQSGKPSEHFAKPSDRLEAKGRFTLEEVSDLNNKTENDLVRPCDVRGILHSHSRYCDGAHPLISMVETAREIGLDYLGISDHFQTYAHEDGMDLASAKVQRHEVDLLRSKYPDFGILQGVELDANPDGTLPVEDQVLMLFDYVIVSFPENDGYDPATFTDQVVKVAKHPLVNILGRPLGDMMLDADSTLLDMERVLKAAAEGGTVVEVSANPNTEHLDWKFCRMAQELDVYMSISPDAHRAARLVDYRHGTELAQAAGVRCCSVINTLPLNTLKDYLGQNTQS